MKRIALLTTLTGIIIFASIFLLPSHEVRAMNVKINVKDLPEHGIRIIPASDPSFDERAATFLQGQPEHMVDRLKPVFALLENRGKLTVVGNSIKWELLKLDGTTFSRNVSSVNPRALMDGEADQALTTMGAAIPPQSIRFISVLGSVEEGRQLDLTRSWISFRGSSSEREEFQRALSTGNMDAAFNNSEIGKVLAAATNITISVDVVFFEDATFIGDESSVFFQTVSADIDAKYDLAREIAASQKQGGTPEEIVSRVSQKSVASPRSPHDEFQFGVHIPNHMSQPRSESESKAYLEAYNRSKALYLRTLVGMKDTLGAKQAISDYLKLLDRPRKELRKRLALSK